MTVTDTITNPFGQSYGDYHAKGWYGTLPIPYRKKKTPPEDYTGYAGAYPSWADLNTWADDGPRNVCQRMRPDMIGIDVDAYGNKPGAETLSRLVTAFGALPPTFMSTSRDDGISGIRYYRVPEGTVLLTKMPGIEFIQRHHRYAVVWPSIHPDTNDTYLWVNEMTGEIGCDIPNVDDIPELPPLWLAGLRGNAGTNAKADLDDDEAMEVLRGFPLGAPCDHVLRAAGRAHEGGSRHDSYNAAVLAACRHGRRGCPGVRDVIATLHTAFVAVVTRPGDGQRTPDEAEHEWRRCLTGALAMVVDEEQGTACPTIVEADWLNGMSAGEAELGGGDDVSRTSWWPRDLAATMAGDDPEPDPEFLARLDGAHLFYRGKVNGIIGESESGKTWVALLAARQALEAGQAVMYLDFEDTASGIVGRLRSMGCRDEWFGNLTYISPDETLSDNAKRDLAETVASGHPDLVVLDGFNAAMTLMGLDINDNGDATSFSQRLLKPLARTGACVVYVDHVPKNKDQRAKGGIGAQAKRAMTTGCAIAVDVAAAFGRGMTGRLRLTIDKDRPGHVRAIAVEARSVGTAVLTSGDDGSVTVEIERATPQEEIAKANEQAERIRVMGAFRQYGRDGAYRSEVAAYLNTKASTIKDTIDWLVSHGQLVPSTTKASKGNVALVVNPDPDQIRWDLS